MVLNENGTLNIDFPSYQNALYDAVVNEVGINRLRVEVNCGMENDKDYWNMMRNGQLPYRCDSGATDCYRNRRYNPINDDSNPNVLNKTRFFFDKLDHQIENTFIPMNTLANARGEKIFLNVNYVCFTTASTYLHADPNEYAEFVLAVYQHLQARHGLTPDAWEMFLEPDNLTNYYKGANTAEGGRRLGAALIAAKNLLVANGFTNPKFIAPSTVNGPNSVPYFKAMAAVSGFPIQNVLELSYHRYLPMDAGLSANIYQAAKQYGISTSMLEFIGATHENLHVDLKDANVSAWQQFSLSYPSPTDDGGSYFIANGTNFSMGARTKFLRQYFKYIRAGAVRIDAQSAASNLDPLAFINKVGPLAGKYVVVVKASSAGSFNILGLPSGNYGIMYTTGSEYNKILGDVTVSTGAGLGASIPAAGVITIYGK